MVISMQFSLSEGLCTKYLGGDRAEHYVFKKKSKALVSVINIFFGFSPWLREKLQHSPLNIQ